MAVSLLKKVNLSSINTRVKAGNTLRGLYNQITLSPLTKDTFGVVASAPFYDITTSWGDSEPFEGLTETSVIHMEEQRHNAGQSRKAPNLRILRHFMSVAGDKAWCKYYNTIVGLVCDVHALYKLVGLIGAHSLFIPPNGRCIPS